MCRWRAGSTKNHPDLRQLANLRERDDKCHGSPPVAILNGPPNSVVFALVALIPAANVDLPECRMKCPNWDRLALAVLKHFLVVYQNLKSIGTVLLSGSHGR